MRIVEEATSPARKLAFTVLGVAILVVGCGAGTYMAITAFTGTNDQINDLARGSLPVAELELVADARETIYIESDGIGDGDSDSPSPRAEALKDDALGARVTVTGPTGELFVEGVGGETVYAFGREGIAVGRIEVPVDGTYTVEVRGFDHDGDVAVGDVSFGTLAKNFGIGLALFVGSIMLSIPVFLLRRKR